MEFRSQKAAYLTIALLPWSLAAAELRYQVHHDHLLKDGSGTLVIDDQGVAYQETSKKKKKKPGQLHHGRWDYQDIQQLHLAPERLTVITYKDRKWLFGIDKEYEFRLLPGQSLKEVYELLKNRLDRRFVAALPDDQVAVMWELPVKLLGTLQGSEGVLRFGPDHVVYKTDKKDNSRTWRYQDIDNISTSDPYELTLTTYERATTHYSSRKGFNFQLKQPLDEKRFDLLWRRLNRNQGLEFLTSIQEGNKQP
jgi:hypothetical protein